MAYRFAGKQKTLALGVYPAVSLEEARRRREEARKLLARSIDPSVQRKADRQAGKGSSFREVAEEVIAKLEREGRAQVTLTKKRWLLDFAYPSFGDRPVQQRAPVLWPHLGLLRVTGLAARSSEKLRLSQISRKLALGPHSLARIVAAP